MFHFRSVLLAVVSLFLVSCASVEKTYSGFYKKQTYRKMAVATDGTALQDAKGKKEILLADKSLKAASLIQERVNAVLKSKGYLPSAAYQATGLSVPNHTEVYVSNDPAAIQGSALTGAHTMTRRGGKVSATQRFAADRLFDRLFSSNLIAKETARATFPEVAHLKIPKGQYLVAVSGMARNVNTSKQVGQAVLIAAVSLGTVVAWEPDVAFVKVAVIDPATQRIVWANQVSGKFDHSKTALKSIDDLLKKLPAYGSIKK